MERKSRAMPQSEGVASIEDVEGAVAALTEQDTYRLERFAKNRIACIGKKALGRTYRELLHESLGAALSGTRRWKPSAVSFVGFLMGAIRSISSHWAESFRSVHAPQGSSDPDSDHSTSPLEKAANPSQTVENALACAQLLDKVEALFAGDEDAELVFSSWRCGDSPADIKDALRWSETQYNTVVRRIYRKARREMGDEYAP